MSTYPVADFLIQIKNAYMAHKESTDSSSSKMKIALAKVLEKEGYLSQVELIKEKNKQPKIRVSLVYQNKKPKVTKIVVVSTPGKKVYVGRGKIPKVLGDFGIAIISTSSGLMTGRDAVKKGIGGELICKIW